MGVTFGLRHIAGFLTQNPCHGKLREKTDAMYRA